MNIHLSWDLFILVFFAVVIAYSFIIGRNQTFKVILGTYVAILCADGLGNIFGRYLAPSQSFVRMLKFFTVGNEDQSIIFFKVLIFLVFIVLIAVRGLFEVDAEDDRPTTIRLIIMLILGILCAGLMISAVLVFISGASLIGDNVATHNIILDVYSSSRLVRIMIDYANLWFLLPGAAFISLGMLHKKSA